MDEDDAGGGSGRMAEPRPTPANGATLLLRLLPRVVASATAGGTPDVVVAAPPVAAAAAAAADGPKLILGSGVVILSAKKEFPAMVGEQNEPFSPPSNGEGWPRRVDSPARDEVVERGG